MESGNWCLYPEAFLSGWEGEQEFADPEYVLQFRSVPPSAPVEPPTPPLPVEPPTPPSPSHIQDPSTKGFEEYVLGGNWEETLAELTSLVDEHLADSGSLPNDQTPSPGSPCESVEQCVQSSETIGHATKRAASDPIEAALFEDSSECASPKRKRKVSCHQTTADENTAAPSYVPLSTPNGNPVIRMDALRSLGTFQGKQFYTCVVPASSDTSATPSRRKQDAEDKPYIKKPPNAFMLFRAEQRPKVVQELHITDSAKVNAVLGQRWKMLSKEEQAPYFEQAHQERRAHEAKYPGWSTKDNFGKKGKKRKNNGFPVLTNHQPFAAPVAPTSQQPAQALPNQALHHQALPNQALPNQALHYQALQNQVLHNQVLHHQALPNQALNHQALPNQVLQNQAPYNQAPYNQALHYQSWYNQAHGNWALYNQAPYGQPLCNQTLNNQVQGIQALDNHVFNSQILDNPSGGFLNQITNIQAPVNIQSVQDLPMETLMFEGFPVQGIPLEAFMKQASDNGVHVQVLQPQPGTSAWTTQDI